MKQIIKCQFTRGGQAYGREYSYYADEPVEVGDAVWLPTSAFSHPDDSRIKGVVSTVGVPESEVASFADKMKTILGKIEAEEEPDGGSLIPGDE